MLYGKLEVEKELEETKKCREIVKEIMDFGVSDREVLKIVQMLSYELENRDAMVALTELVKQFIYSEQNPSITI